MVVCPNCDHDGPRKLIRHVLLSRRTFPFVEFPRLCPRCRRELGVGPGNRVLIVLFILSIIAAVAAVGFGIVTLLQCLIPNASAS